MTAHFEPDPVDSTEPALASNWARCRTSDGQRIFYQHTVNRKKQVERPVDCADQRNIDARRMEHECAFWKEWSSKVAKETGVRVYHNMRTNESTTVRPAGFALTAWMQSRDDKREKLVENGLYVRKSSSSKSSSNNQNGGESATTSSATANRVNNHQEQEGDLDGEQEREGSLRRPWEIAKGMEEPSSSCETEEEWRRQSEEFQVVNTGYVL